MSACTGFRAKVKGSSRDMEAAGPNPGSTPTKVPTKHPQKHRKRLIGSRAILKERSSWLKASMQGLFRRLEFSSAPGQFHLQGGEEEVGKNRGQQGKRQGREPSFPPDRGQHKIEEKKGRCHKAEGLQEKAIAQDAYQSQDQFAKTTLLGKDFLAGADSLRKACKKTTMDNAMVIRPMIKGRLPGPGSPGGSSPVAAPQRQTRPRNPSKITRRSHHALFHDSFIPEFSRVTRPFSLMGDLRKKCDANPPVWGSEAARSFLVKCGQLSEFVLRTISYLL